MNDRPESGARAGVLRLTPYEVAFASTPYETEIFPAIAADAALHGTDPLHLDPFTLLPATSDAVRSFVPAEAPPEALEQYRVLLYHAFNYWRLERPTYLIHPATARYLVEAQPRMEAWELTVPRPSLYLQLPHNLFWGSVTPDSTPEAVDGMFVTVAPARSPSGKAFQRLELLLVLGLRRDRAGFSVIPFDTEAGPGIAAAWAESGARESGADFENILPGGEISGLYSVLTVGEVLKLLGRILWYIDTSPADVSPEMTGVETAVADEHPSAAGRSRLAYRLVTLGSAGGEPAP